MAWKLRTNPCLEMQETCGCGSPFAHRPAGKQAARSSLGQQVPIGLAHGAFLARRFRRAEPADNSVQNIDPTVDPFSAHLGRALIDEDTRFAVIKRANDHVGPAEISHPDVAEHIAVHTDRFDLRIDPPCGGGGASTNWLRLLVTSEILIRTNDIAYSSLQMAHFVLGSAGGITGKPPTR